MRQGQQNRRGRGRNNNHQNRKGQHHHNPLMRTYQSNGPDQKIHGTPAQIAEKYMSLARDALSSGDPVLAENYLQHAEHYNRIILTYREQQIQQGGGEGMNGGGMPRHRPFPGPGEPFEGGAEGSEEGEDAGSGDQPQPHTMRHGEQQPRMHGEGQPRGDDRPDRQQRHHHQQGEQGYRDRGEQGQGFQQRDRGDRDRDRDRDRGFRQRGDQRFNQDRQGGDRGDRGDRGEHRNDRERFPRGDSNGERHERFDRGERHDRGPRPQHQFAERHERGEPSDRPERMERPERGERVERQERPEREPYERPIPAAAQEPDRSSDTVATGGEAPAPAPAPRRRERFVEATSDQPEFLRRPVRRPRREASADNGESAPPAERPAPPERSRND